MPATGPFIWTAQPLALLRLTVVFTAVARLWSVKSLHLEEPFDGMLDTTEHASAEVMRLAILNPTVFAMELGEYLGTGYRKGCMGLGVGDGVGGLQGRQRLFIQRITLDPAEYYLASAT